MVNTNKPNDLEANVAIDILKRRNLVNYNESRYLLRENKLKNWTVFIKQTSVYITESFLKKNIDLS